MSHLNLSLILSPQAETDFTDILQYTLETWGEPQVHVYSSLLDQALLMLQQHPYIGQQLHDIGQQLHEFSTVHRVYPVGKHVIIYRIVNHTVYVSRILHERMNIKRNLS